MRIDLIRGRVVQFEAARWFKNGDHPEDGPSDREGRVVRLYRRPDIPGHRFCGHCDTRMAVHGWIDVPPNGRTVCPGDWIAKAGDGLFFPVKPELYAVAYESVPADG